MLDAAAYGLAAVVSNIDPSAAVSKIDRPTLVLGNDKEVEKCTWRRLE
jgi:hypothetical protein